MEITFKGRMQTIPAGAALVVQFDTMLTGEMAERVKAHVEHALGPNHKVLVLGKGARLTAVEPAPA